MKRCSKCGVEKDESAFYKDRGKKDGLYLWCKECASEHEKQRLAKTRTPYDPENVSAWHKGKVSAWLGTLSLRPCWTCHRTLPVTAFNKDVNGSAGLQTRCRECAGTAFKAYFDRSRAGALGACKVVDSEGNMCARPIARAGLCNAHYVRVRNDKGLEAPVHNRQESRPLGLGGPMDVAMWFLTGIEPDDNDCWPWPGTIGQEGYGKVGIEGTTYAAHRLVYEQLTGKDLTGLHLHHICHNKECVNPNHLRPMTPEEHAALHATEGDPLPWEWLASE